MPTQNKRNYCIAFVPDHISIYNFLVDLIKKYNLSTDIKFIPQIILIEPFYWDEKNEYLLTDTLKKYANQSVSIELNLSGFNKKEDSFCLKIEENNDLKKFQKSLQYYLEIHNKIVFENYSIDNYKPEMCLPLKIETTRKFNKIWQDLNENTFNLNFIANNIHLLHCNSGYWEVSKTFELE